jgi:GntR family galactonate operon transcriptional repressor|tara:strand:+ start:25747 stop:26508 length:762 start_codon:yes stop_codon:yes gene_type:complete
VEKIDPYPEDTSLPSVPQEAPAAKRSSTLSEQAAAELGRSIINGHYPPLYKLPIEWDLAKDLSVSRNALREAVKILRGKRLLTTAPRRGTIVSAKSEWNLLDPEVMSWAAEAEEFLGELTEFRQGIEPTIAALAAMKATKSDVASIYSAYVAMVEADDTKSSLEADLRFHESIIDATHNIVYSALKPAFVTLLRSAFCDGLRLHKLVSFRENLDRHRAIVDAISAGDAELARQATEKLVEKHKYDVLLFLSKT